MGLQQFEQRLERLFEGVFAKAFRSGLEPVELGRRLVRQMDRDRRVGPSGRRVAPNAFSYRLSPADLERFASFQDALRDELVAAAREHARAESYAFLGRIQVELVEDQRLSPGTFELDTEVRPAPGGGAVGSLVVPGGRRVELEGEAVTIGRQESCHVVLDDPTVSRNHAEVRRTGDGFEVVDLGSRNGTKVNGFGVTRQHLADGDDLLVGAVPLRFEAV
ncbi:MAG: DUF3662 and FHA domain-containing protein [Acidimicrobiales bacterium]